MKKLFSAYLQQTGQEASAVRFLFEGERVNDTDTPEKVKLNCEMHFVMLMNIYSLLVACP